MIKENYPEIIKGKSKTLNKYSFKSFDGGNSYKEDYEKALKYAKKIKGEVYTIIDGWGYSVDYFKGLHYVDRLGFCVLKKEVKK